MNLSYCIDYITSLNFGLTSTDIEDYNNTFLYYCDYFRDMGEIKVKDDDMYSDEELYNYSLKIMKCMIDNNCISAKKISYMLREGFLDIASNGVIIPCNIQNFNFNIDISDVEE